MRITLFPVSHVVFQMMVSISLLSSLTIAQDKAAAAQTQDDFYRHIAKNVLLVKSHGLEVADRQSPVLQAYQELGEVPKTYVIQVLAERLDAKNTFGIRDPLKSPLSHSYPVMGSLGKIGYSTRSFVVKAVASKQRTEDFREMAIYLIRGYTDPRSNEPTRYFLLHTAASYDERAKRLRQWAEKLPYGEMPTKAMLEAEPVAAPELKPEPNYANEAEREAAINRLARIFELHDVLSAPDVQWTQDEERQKVFDALDELIQLNAIGEGEAGQEMAKKLDFLFAPEPPKPLLPFQIGPLEPQKPIVPPHPIKPLIYGEVPQGSTKTETYFPAVPKLIKMGPRIAPFIVEEMSEHYGGQLVQNGVYALRRILGSDDSVKKLLLEYAAQNEKKAQRLRELRDMIPAN